MSNAQIHLYITFSFIYIMWRSSWRLKKKCIFLDVGHIIHQGLRHAISSAPSLHFPILITELCAAQWVTWSDHEELRQLANRDLGMRRRQEKESTSNQAQGFKGGFTLHIYLPQGNSRKQMALIQHQRTLILQVHTALLQDHAALLQQIQDLLQQWAQQKLF